MYLHKEGACSCYKKNKWKSTMMITFNGWMSFSSVFSFGLLLYFRIICIIFDDLLRKYMFIYMNFECAYVISFGHTVGIKGKSHAMLKHFASTIYNCIVTFRHVINLVVFTWMGIYWLHLFMSGQIHFILPHFPMIKNAQNASM